jgi:hypothetical protein
MTPPFLRHGLPELCPREWIFGLQDQDLHDLCSRHATLADLQKGEVAPGAK